MPHLHLTRSLNINAASTHPGQLLLPIARAAIADLFGQTLAAPEDAAWLQEPGACFVTLAQCDARGDEQLRGCIGTLTAHRSLLADVKANARAAAIRDPRFMPLAAAELPHTRIEISLLSPPQLMAIADEADALRQLQPGSDGVVFEYSGHRATFLPQVWEQLPIAQQFLAQLKRKCGLPADFWSQDVKLYRYSVSKWKETDATPIEPIER